MLKEAFGEQALSQARTFEWFKWFNLWKMINILVDRPHAQLRKWLRKCVEIILEDRLSTKFHLVRLSMGSFTVRFWDEWRKMWGANCLRCGRMETDYCTMTMRLHTPRSLWGNSSQKMCPLFPTLPTHLTWPPAISTCSLKWNSGWKGDVSPPLKRS
jgi:hypothetical protein